MDWRSRQRVVEHEKHFKHLHEKKMSEEKEEKVKAVRSAVKELLADSDSSDSHELKRAPKKLPTLEDVAHSVKFIEDVPMRLHAEIARTNMPLRNILSWKNGSVVRFDKIVGEPIDLLIGEQLIARGEVVVVNDRYGIRISEITRPDEKVGDFRP